MKQERAKWDDGIYTGTCIQYSGSFSELIDMIRKGEFGGPDKSKTWIEDLWDFLKTCKARAEELERSQERYWEDFKMDCVNLESYLESLKSGKYQGTQDATFCAFQAGILYNSLLVRVASEHLRKRYDTLKIQEERRDYSVKVRSERLQERTDLYKELIKKGYSEKKAFETVLEAYNKRQADEGREPIKAESLRRSLRKEGLL